METHLIVNSILKIGWGKKIAIRHIKLQKLLYLSCGWHSANHNTWLIEGDFKALHYGPTETETYYALRRYGGAPIESYMHRNYVANKGDFPQVYQTLDFVFGRYGDQDDFTLAEVTHQKDSPWWNVYVRDKNPGGDIKREVIRKHYRSLKKELGV